MKAFVRVAPLALLLACLLLFIFVSFRGIFFADEGYILNSAARILDGQIPYRDFDFVYTPLTPYLSTLAFIAFGKSIFAARLLHVFLTIGITWYLYTASRSLTKNRVLAFIPTLLYLAWGPTHLNFLNPSMYAVNFGIIAVVSFLTGNLHRSSRSGYITALALILAILSKQNFGVAILLTLLIGSFLLRKRLTRLFLKPFLQGVVIAGFILLLFILLTNSLVPFYRNMFDHVFQTMILGGSLNTEFGLNFNLFSLSKLALYTAPLTLSLWAISQAFRVKSPLVILPVFCLTTYLIGIRPETDYIHLVPLLALTGFPLFTLLLTLKQVWFKRLIIAISAGLFLLGVWSAVFFAYYRFEAPLITQSLYITHPRVHIWADQHIADNVLTVSTLMNDYTKPGEEVYLNYYAPMIYFLTDRRNPTRYDYTGLGTDYQQELIKTLEKKKIPTVIQYRLGKNAKSPIDRYIESRYVKLKSVEWYEIWIRKAEFTEQTLPY